MGLRLLTWRTRYFRDGVTTAPFADHLSAVEADWPAVDSVGVGTHEVSVETLAGSHHAAIAVHKWVGLDAPTLIWHHGGGEHPYDSIFTGAFPDAHAVGANLLLVRAPGHEARGGVQHVGATLEGYLAMLATSVAATEHVLDSLEAARTVVAGYSLGGFATNRHHVAYDTADAYVPFMAGTAHGEIFLTTVPAAPRALARPDYLRRRLDFIDGWRRRDNDSVRPILGLDDCLNRYETQRASYPGVNPETWPVGHIRGISAHDAIRAVLEEELFEPEET